MTATESLPNRLLHALMPVHWLSREDLTAILWPDAENRPQTHSQMVRNMCNTLDRQGRIEILEYQRGKTRKRLYRLADQQQNDSAPQGQHKPVTSYDDEVEILFDESDDELEIDWED